MEISCLNLFSCGLREGMYHTLLRLHSERLLSVAEVDMNYELDHV